MLPISSVSSAAVLILEQANAGPASARPRGAPADQLVAAANGLSAGTGSPSRQAQARITEALFSVTTVDVNKLKINLMQRLGEQFGLALEDFETQSAFGAAVRDAIGQLKLQDGGLKILAAIEKELGLNKLGLSLDTLVNAIVEPEGADGETLDAALGRQIDDEGDKTKREDALAALARLTSDDTGLYGF